MSRRVASCLFLSFVALACSSTGVGNPGVTRLSLSSDPEVEPNVADAGEQLDPANLRHAVLVFSEVRFLACDPTNDDDAIVTGPFVVDLAQNRVTPNIPPVSWPTSGFCGIDATLGPAAAPAAIAGRSLFFSGLRSDGTLFLLFANMSGRLRMQPLTGVTWELEPDKGWIWALRPRRWLLPSELDSSNTEPLDGIGRVIAIDIDRHPLLYSAIRARLGGSSTLHIDLNDTGLLEPDERLGEALIGQGLDSIE